LPIRRDARPHGRGAPQIRGRLVFRRVAAGAFMSQDQQINRLGTEPISKLLVRFSLPAIATMTIISLYNIVSGIFIGQGVGPLAIAGLAVTFPFMNLVFAVSMLVAIGSATVCSIALGAQNPQRAALMLGHNVVLSVLFAVVFSAVCLVFIDPMLRLFGASDDTIAYARDYKEVILWCSPIGNLMLAFNHFLRASGYPARSMLLSVSSVIVNLILTPLFIYTFGWGIRGAAVATVLSQLAALIGMILHFSSPKSAVHFKKGIFRLRLGIIKRMVSIGLSPFLMNFCACIVVLVINLSLRAYGGDLSIGAYGVVNRLLMLVAMIIIGLTQGMQPIIGYNYGARCLARVHQTLRYGIIAATGVTVLGFLALQFIPYYLARLFTDHAGLISMAVDGQRLCSAAIFLVGAQIVISAYFQSMGKAGIAIFLSLSRQLIFLIPGLILLPRIFGLNGIWISLPVADVLAFIVSGAILRLTWNKEV
jgi:putative MATE family efflux protein